MLNARNMTGWVSFADVARARQNGPDFVRPLLSSQVHNYLKLADFLSGP
jgi:hypothetical protein